MADIYCICGFIGSGKTTYSKSLVDCKGAFRFSIDEWMIPLYGEHMEREEFDSRLRTLQTLFYDAALQLASLDVPVIFDFGFWKVTDRIEVVSWAEKNNLEIELHYLDVSYDCCQQRALQRNLTSESRSYEMTPEMLELFWSRFEVPSPDENVIWVPG